MAKSTEKNNPTRFSAAERIAIENVLSSFKLWWQTPVGATGEEGRLHRLIDSIDAMRSVIEGGKS